MSKRIVTPALVLLVCTVAVGCGKSESPLLPSGPAFTGYIGGGGRAAPTDSTTISTADNTGYIGGGGRAVSDSTNGGTEQR